MSLLSRLLHLLLCLALAAGGPGVAAAGTAHAGHDVPPAPTPAATDCHGTAAMHDGRHAPAGGDARTDTAFGAADGPVQPDDCCEEGACPCPGVSQVALAVPTITAAGPLRPSAAPAAAATAARGPPRLAALIRPPIG